MGHGINETGYYYHTNGHGNEEIVFVDFYCGIFWVQKLRGQSDYPLSDDKGEFGERILLPSEEY